MSVISRHLKSLLNGENSSLCGIHCGPQPINANNNPRDGDIKNNHVNFLNIYYGAGRGWHCLYEGLVINDGICALPSLPPDFCYYKVARRILISAFLCTCQNNSSGKDKSPSHLNEGALTGKLGNKVWLLQRRALSMLLFSSCPVALVRASSGSLGKPKALSSLSPAGMQPLVGRLLFTCPSRRGSTIISTVGCHLWWDTPSVGMPLLAQMSD